jgi:hypothetical protein
MIRLHIIAEGQSEEAFINKVLNDYLARFGIVTDVQCITTSIHNNTIHRGGFVNYEHLKNDILKRMKNDNRPIPTLQHLSISIVFLPIFRGRMKSLI